MTWSMRLVAIALVFTGGCKAENPLYGAGDALLDGSEGGLADSGGETDAGDDVEDLDGDAGDDAGDDAGESGEDGPSLEMCAFEDQPGFAVALGEGFSAVCGQSLHWYCNVTGLSTETYRLVECCDAADECDDQFSTDIRFTPFDPPPEIEGRVQFRAAFDGTDECGVHYAELFSPLQTFPYVAGATVPGAELHSLVVTLKPPEPEGRCACEGEVPDCCSSEAPPGAYSLEFALPDFNPAFNVKLGPGEEFDSPIGGLGHPIVRNIASYRTGECNSPPIVDWAMAAR